MFTSPPLRTEPPSPSEGDVSTCAESFARAGYVKVVGLLDRARADRLWAYVQGRARTGTLNLADAQVPGTPSAYGDPAMERLLEWLRPAIQRIVALDLAPTYSYFRVYKHGDTLARHVDRSSCEISVTVNLGQRPHAPWPLGIEGREGAAWVDLRPGDAVVYRGIECPHWRDAYDGERLGQVFLHYVDRAGPYASWRFDRRPALKLS